MVNETAGGSDHLSTSVRCPGRRLSEHGRPADPFADLPV